MKTNNQIPLKELQTSLSSIVSEFGDDIAPFA